MKSWYYQTDRSYGQLDARDEAHVKIRVRAIAGSMTDKEMATIKIWEATPGAPQPKFPREEKR